MDNKTFISEYIEGKKGFGANGHLGYAGNSLFNYSTEICIINREKKSAKVNVRKYSKSTSDIVGCLKFRLSQSGYTIEEYIGPPAEMWNTGKCGARNLTKEEMRNK